LADWVEIIVPVGAADVDDVAALIASDVGAAAAGTEQRGDEIVFWVDAADVASALAETRDAVTRWAAGGAALDPARVRTAAAMPEAEWRDAWKRYFKVSRLTRQFVVVPSWTQYTAAADDVVIDLDPGMAFGTGTHASTQLVLEELQELADAGFAPARVLDVGCGSGILAIASVKRWPGATCIAVDNDPIAVAATRDNAAVNKVEIDAAITPLGEISGEFPLVLANIQAHVLRELKSALIERAAGTLILSGLLTPQAQPLAEEFGLPIVRVKPSTDDAQWSSVTLSRL
jgi:ribosomal protein L11 methyltransferase